MVLSQFDVLEGTGKKLMTEEANSYACHSSDILNVPLTGNDFKISMKIFLCMR